jgi:predicted metalloprotease with PDZ domain
MVRRAGLISNDDFLSGIAVNINNYENDPGRFYQTLTGSSYNTWSDGPFGNKPGTQDRSISYYEKGPVIGMILDLTIRKATNNKRSLDDVMRLLYYEYYKTLQRGFTDAEFQETCEEIAGVSLAREFEYVYTTKEFEYADYLSYAGLKLLEERDSNTGKRTFSVSMIPNPDASQKDIFRSLTGE